MTRRPDKQHGIPKLFRQYARRYGAGVDALIQAHAQHPTPLIDHWRDRLAKKNPNMPRPGDG